MIDLNLPKHSFQIKSSENKQFIFDVIRKKFLVLTPEEWVRQHFIHFLIHHKNYPASRMAIEKTIRFNGLSKRTDITIYGKDGMPEVLIECKAPQVKLDQTVFDQIARYYSITPAKFLVVTNGLQHIYCTLDQQNKKYIFLKELPDYKNV